MLKILGRTILPVLLLALLLYSATPVLADSTLSLSRTSGTPGTAVTITGAGFGATETGITVTFNGTAVISSITAVSGTWTSSFVIPAIPSGSYIVDAFGTVTTTTNVTDVIFTVTPSISLSKTTGPAGTAVAVTGAGFAASETGITVTFDGAQVATGIAANAQGGWTANFNVPVSPSGSRTVDASGLTTAATSVPDTTFSISAGISINKTSGPTGTAVTVTGTGFGASETGITVTFDGTQVASAITASAQGGWTANFNVPAASSGSHVIDASGSITQVANIADLAFAISPTISASRANGPSGTAVTVTGAGFGASETGITVTFGGSPVATGITANAQGAWTANFNVPAAAAGAHVVDAQGSVTQAANVPDLTFAISAGISLGRTNGLAGNTVPVTGNGFGAGETGITITFDGSPVATGITANAQGGWSASFIVPTAPSGSHAISAFGATTQATNVGEKTFFIGAGVTMNPTSGNVGITVDIAGAGFAANSPISVTYDDKELTGEATTTDASGSFRKQVVIPKSKGGAHPIRIADSQRNESRLSFTVENAPPPVPRQLSPEDGTGVGLLGGATPALRWTGVTDPSGVTYSLQIDTSPDFTQPVLQKSDIPGSSYTLTAAEALPKGQYYWRVRAMDGASNQSEWSPAWQLKSGVMSLWVLLAIIVLGVAVVGVAAYIVAVRLTARRREAAVAIGEAGGPRIIPGEWRPLETEEGKPRPLPWRLALPTPAKGAKIRSPEDLARLKVVADFAESLPLVEPGYDVKWLLELMDSGTMEASPTIYGQLLRGELTVRYEPAWVRHPLYGELTSLLEGQTVLQDLNEFVASVNRCATDASSLLQEIYHDAVAESSPDFLEKGGWAFVSSVYSDAMSWFRGKSLRDPSERDYGIKPAEGSEAEVLWLCGEDSTSFAGQLIQAPDEKEASRFRALHLKLRRTARNSNRARQVVSMMTQLEVQRSRLHDIFGKLSSIVH
ncbi:MAG: IPT/TIG domain-containing protein [Chloroflexi bacterium]|nr:IPT/TIG domain-containing protein [Chloroflexota bacterium]